MIAIKEILTRIGENKGYANALKLLPHFDYCGMFFLNGGRGIGKTDLFLQAQILLWKDYKKETIWLRNTDKQLERNNFQNSFLNDQKKFGWCDESFTCEKDGVHIEGRNEPVIIFQSVNTFSNFRGGAHPDVEMIVFDEYMSEQNRYPSQCAIGLLSIIETQFRRRESCKCFCLSNNTNITNPYFVKYKIYPQPDKEITVYKDKGMLIQNFSNRRPEIKDSTWNKVYKQQSVNEYESTDRYSLNTIVKQIKKGMKPQFYQILIDGIYYRAFVNSSEVIWCEWKSSLNNVRVWSPNVNECSDSVQLLPNVIFRDIKQSFEAGQVYFNHPNTMFQILNLIYDGF